MWKLLDYKTESINSCYDVDVVDYYQMMNIKTRETKWVNKDEYRRMGRLGLLY